MVPDDDAPAPPGGGLEATVREFAERFGREAIPAAVDGLTDAGRDRIVESFPDEFREDEDLDAETALAEYRWALSDRYGEFERVGAVDVRDGEAAVDLEFARGSEAATVGVDGDGVTALSFDPTYEPPSYADREAFHEREITVDARDVALDGLLAVPDADGPVPGVALVHGHGIHDPDGTAGASKLLKDLAWGLATRGIASLRYAKRLRDHEVPDDEYTLDSVVVDDAVDAVEELTAANGVDAVAVFVAGHSQGGTCAPRIAARHGGVAGVVNLDGIAETTVDPDDLTWLRYGMEPDGDLDEAQQAELEAQRETFRRIAEGEFADEETIMGYPGAWHRSHLEYDPIETASGLDVPVFVATTARVDEEEQAALLEWRREAAAAWEGADLPAGSRTEFYDGLNHYFQPGPTPWRPIGLYFGGTVDASLVADVAEWIHGVRDG